MPYVRMAMIGNVSTCAGSPRIIPTIRNQKMKLPNGCRFHRLHAAANQKIGPTSAITIMKSCSLHDVPVIPEIALAKSVIASSPTWR